MDWNMSSLNLFCKTFSNLITSKQMFSSPKSKRQTLSFRKFTTNLYFRHLILHLTFSDHTITLEVHHIFGVVQKSLWLFTVLVNKISNKFMKKHKWKFLKIHLISVVHISMYLIKIRWNTKKMISTKINKKSIVSKLTLLSRSWKFNKNHPMLKVKKL